MAILVVIDMQPLYQAAQSVSLQRRIADAVRAWTGPVCIVEFEKSGDTFPSILAACKGKRLFRCTKTKDDGGDVIVGATFAERLGHHRHYHLCGVNAPYCVINTAQGILHYRKNSKVTLRVNLCRGFYDNRAREGDPPFETDAATQVWCREDDYREHRRRRFLSYRLT